MKARSSDVVWLEMIGSVGNSCSWYLVPKGQGITHWRLDYDFEGIQRSSFLISNGDYRHYGIKKSGALKHEYSFTPATALLGFWGTERFSVASLGAIMLDTNCDLPELAEDPREVVIDNSSETLPPENLEKPVSEPEDN